MRGRGTYASHAAGLAADDRLAGLPRAPLAAHRLGDRLGDPAAIDGRADGDEADDALGVSTRLPSRTRGPAMLAGKNEEDDDMAAAAKRVADPADELEAALDDAHSAYDQASGERTELDARLADARAAHDTAKVKLDGLNAARPELLRRGDDADIERHDQDVVRAQRAVDRAAARIEAIEQSLTTARESEARAARAWRRAKAQKLAAEIPEAFALYRQQAEALAGTLTRLQKISSAIDEANKERGMDGFIRSPDDLRFAARVRAETPVTRAAWIDARTGHEVAGPGRFHRRGEVVSHVVSNGQPEWKPPKLLETVALPRVFRDDPEIWPPAR